MVTSPVAPYDPTRINPVAPPQLSTPPVAPAPSFPRQPQPAVSNPPVAGAAVVQTNGTDQAQFSQQAISAQQAPTLTPGNAPQNTLPPATVEFASTSNVNNAVAPFPGTPPNSGPEANQAPGQNQNPSTVQSNFAQAPYTPFQDLTAGQNLDLTA
ncbi:MAG: hypothetical protein GC154_13685 [bacterium]|nr:hypothetical protein [bacterium]